MLRSKRKAAHNAMTRMQEIFDWENMTEDSELFQACAAKIDVEFECELKSKRLAKNGLDVQDSHEEWHADEENSCDDNDDEEDEVLTQEDIEFVEEDDYQEADSEWTPATRNKNPRKKQKLSGVSHTRANDESGDSAAEDSAEDSEDSGDSAEDAEDSADDAEDAEDSAEDAEDEPTGPREDTE
jgi:hypothetical protein